MNRLGRVPWIVVGVLLLLNLAGVMYLLRPAPTAPPPPAPVVPKVALIQPIDPPAPTQVIPAEPPRPAAPPRAVEPARRTAPARPAAPSSGAVVRPAPPSAQSAPPVAPPAAPTLPGTVGGPALSGTPPARPATEKPVVRTTPDARVTIARPEPAPPTAAAPTRADSQRFKLEVLSYSDVPAQRLVFINGRRYREGETLDGGVKVEEIREDSVILSEAGQRFTLR